MDYELIFWVVSLVAVIVFFLAYGLWIDWKEERTRRWNDEHGDDWNKDIWEDWE